MRRARRALDVALWGALVVGSVLVIYSPHTGTGPWWVGMVLLAVAAVAGIAALVVRSRDDAAAQERVRT